MDAIEGFPAKLKTVVQHMLISPHANTNSVPQAPMIREALAFHYMDDLDPSSPPPAPLSPLIRRTEWSAYSGALGRKFLRLDQF